jgi:hypothetical protein
MLQTVSLIGGNAFVAQLNSMAGTSQTPAGSRTRRAGRAKRLNQSENFTVRNPQ